MAETEAKSTSRNRRRTPDWFDYKDVKTLRRYLNSFGQIEPRTRTGLSTKQQRRLARAIKRARELALLPYEIR